MKQNMGSADRTIRLAVAAILVVLIFLNVVGQTGELIMGAVALIFALTGMLGTCPLYSLLHLSTKK